MPRFSSRAVMTLAVSASILSLALSPPASAGSRVVESGATLDQITFRDGQVLSRTTQPLDVVRGHVAEQEAKPDTGNDAAGGAGKISPRLSTAGERVRVLVTFVEDQQLPELPDLDPDQPESAAVNQAALATTDTLIDALVAKRGPAYQQLRTDFERLGGQVLHTRWLIKGLQAEVPLAAVPSIAARSDVRFVEPDDSDVAPASYGDGDAGNDESVARALMGTDGYFNLSHAGERIGILDTGVRLPHTLLNSWDVSRYDVSSSHNPDDDCWNHGTGTAAVVSGNSSLGNAFRGITNEHVDSIKVFPSGMVKGKCRLTTPDLTVAGFELATKLRDTTIIAPLQHVEGENGQVAVAADAAFDAGATVIACNGNLGISGAPGTVTSPAVARKAIGVGAVDVKTFATIPEQSRGPSGDGRFKPDIVAPTNVETAVTSSSTGLGVSSGTSAASANAGGAAAAFRSFLRGQGNTVLPGHVYAGLILSGSNPVAFDNVQGAGKLKLPTGGAYFHPTIPLALHPGETLSFALPMAATSCRLSAAIWWPENAGRHNDVDLVLINPQQQMVAASTNTPGVFEMVRTSGPTMGGTWTVRIVAGNVAGTQYVYPAATTCR